MTESSPSFNTVQRLIREGKSIAELRAAGATWSMLIRVGFSSDALIANGMRKKLAKGAERNARKMETKRKERAAVRRYHTQTFGKEPK